MNDAVQCCAGEHIPGETACARNSREMVVTRPSENMVAGDRVPWQVYPLCGVYHRGSNLAAMVRQADPDALVYVIERLEGKDLVPGHYRAQHVHPQPEG